MPSIIKRDRVLSPEAVVVTTGQPAPPVARCDKAVEVLRFEGVVHAIQITCSCGEVSVVELSYDTAPGPDPEASEVPS